MEFTLAKPNFYFHGDHVDIVSQRLAAFEGGMAQFQLCTKWPIQKIPHQGGGTLKMEWLNKLKNFPSVIIFIQDLTENIDGKFDNLGENYRQVLNKGKISKKFQSKVVLLLVGKNIHSFDFSLVKKDIDFRRAVIIELENIGSALKRIKKMVIEDYFTFYEELYNKYKMDSAQLPKGDMSEKQLILQIKKTLLSEVVNNQKRGFKHLQTAYGVVKDLATKRREALVIEDQQALCSSYELILQAEEYREIADQLKMKLIKDVVDVNEVCQQFDEHFRHFKNMIQAPQFKIQEYLWRIKIFTDFITFIQPKILQINYNTVYNYFQATMLNYLHVKQLYQHAYKQQGQYEIVVKPKEFVGRKNYAVMKDGKEMEMRAELKAELYTQVIAYRVTEAEQIPSIDFLFPLFEKYTENDVQYQHAVVYVKYLKAFVLGDFEVRSHSNQLLRFGLYDEFVHLTQTAIEFAPTVTTKLQLLFELLLHDQDQLDDILKLADKLEEKLEFIIPASNVAVIELNSLINEATMQFKLQINLNQKIIDLLDQGELILDSQTLEFSINSNFIDLELNQDIINPKVNLKGRYKNLFVTFQCQPSIKHGDIILNEAKLTKRQGAKIRLLKTTAYINEINEIDFELAFFDTVALINFCDDRQKLLLLKDPTQSFVKKGTILISDNKVHERVIQLKIGPEEVQLLVQFIFPFDFTIAIKQIDSVYKNSQNRARKTISTHSKGVIQFQVKIPIVSSSFEPLVDLQFENSQSFNVLFKTQDAAIYKNFGIFHVQYQRDENQYKVAIPVNDIQVVNYNHDISIVAPPQCTFSVPFQLELHIKSAMPQTYFVMFKEETQKKQFFIMGMVRKSIHVEDTGVVKFTIFPFEHGRCNIPGITVEIRSPGQPNQLIFDSSGLKSIYVIP